MPRGSERIEGLPRLHERVLDDVLGVLPVPECAHREAQESDLVPVDEGGEGVDIAFTGPHDEGHDVESIITSCHVSDHRRASDLGTCLAGYSEESSPNRDCAAAGARTGFGRCGEILAIRA